MSGSRQALLIFTRYPRAGRVKTRLIPVLGPAGAAAMHDRMTRHTLRVVKAFRRRHRVDVEIRYAGGDVRRMRSWIGRSFSLGRQRAGDLGAGMQRAFERHFRLGRKAVVIIGTDCPGLTPGILGKAFRALERSPVVFGPAADGGYYLVGLRAPMPALFRDMPWGTDAVLRRSRKRAEQLGFAPVLLPVLRDVDRPEDLAVCKHGGTRGNRNLFNDRSVTGMA